MKQEKRVTGDREERARALAWVTGVLERYLEGKLAERDAGEVAGCLASLDRRAVAKSTLTKKQLAASDGRVRRRVFRRSLLDAPGPVAPFQPFKSRGPSFVPPSRRYAVASVAACAVLVATAYLALDDGSPARPGPVASPPGKTLLLRTGESETREVTLADGTRLHVNGGSRVEYIKEQFNGEKRELWLEGEAFFDVAKDPARPFIVHGGSARSVVRGTSFNMSAYREIAEVSVAVTSGKVDVIVGDEVVGALVARQRLVYDEKSARHRAGEIDPAEASAWRERRLVLRDAGVAELRLRLRQLYGVDLVVEGAFPEEARFGLSFRGDATLPDVLRVINR
ncbi:MAG: FecR domain-containing protein, partial [Odoribacteraceae bacterium]|nr:FecR domain-containing protein [Odoribacteraceae bacterium]